MARHIELTWNFGTKWDVGGVQNILLRLCKADSGFVSVVDQAEGKAVERESHT